MSLAASMRQHPRIFQHGHFFTWGKCVCGISRANYDSMPDCLVHWCDFDSNQGRNHEVCNPPIADDLLLH